MPIRQTGFFFFFFFFSLQRLWTFFHSYTFPRLLRCALPFSKLFRPKPFFTSRSISEYGVCAISNFLFRRKACGDIEVCLRAHEAKLLSSRHSARSGFGRELPYVGGPATKMTPSGTRLSAPQSRQSMSRDWAGKACNNLDQIGLSVCARLVE